MDIMSGYIDMYGDAIKLAIIDYRSYKNRYKKMEKELERLTRIKEKTHKQKNRICWIREALRHYETAKAFLFNPDWLEKMIQMCGLPLNIDYVRKKAEENLMPNLESDQAYATRNNDYPDYNYRETEEEEWDCDEKEEIDNQIQRRRKQ
jgi:hypothetical protein